MSLFSRKNLTTTSNSTVGNYIHWDSNNDLDLNAHYQRDYVWGEKEQQQFLFSLFNNLPLGMIAVVDKDEYREGIPNYEIVDGKQRITTLLMFVKGEISYKVDSKEYFYDDLSDVDRRCLGQKGMPYQLLCNNITEQDKLEYFYRINFVGVPQSEEHMNKVLELLKDSNNPIK